MLYARAIRPIIPNMWRNLSGSIRVGEVRAYSALRYCFKIQLDTFSSATGDIVSSICAYSAGEPVFAVWNK